jgi:hypothetical protein
MIARSAVWSAKPSEGLHPMGIIRPDPFHEFGHDPLRGMSPATVIDSRRPGTTTPFKRSSVVRPQQALAYGTAVAAIVAVTRFRSSSLPSPYKEIV